MRRTRDQTRRSKFEDTQTAIAAIPLVPTATAAAAASESSVKEERAVSTRVTRTATTTVSTVVESTKREPTQPAAKTNKTATAPADSEMTEYERKRLENIQRNLDFMKSMGVSTAKAAARTAIGGASVKGHLATKGVQPKRKPTEPQLPTRKSRRIQGQQTDFVALGEQYREVLKQEALGRDAAQDTRRARFDARLVAEALNLSGEQGKSLLQSIVGGIDAGTVDGDSDDSERESDLQADASGVDTVDYALSADDIVKAAEERIYSVVFHPRADKLVVATGDKRGNVSLWSADAPREQQDVVAMYRPHTSPVTQLHVAPQDASKLLSASFDGSVREFDLHAAAFTELFGTRDNVGITSMALDCAQSALLVSCEDGHIWSVDPRAAPAEQTKFLLHEKKINTVHQHPQLPFCLATASLDRTVCLWDARKLTATTNEPLVTMPHRRSVNCAYFSPSGEHLVTVGQDDYVNLFDTREAKHADAHSVVPTLAIPHNNQTGRWLTKLHAAWDPKHTDRFVIGSLQQPRRLQIFAATRKQPIQELTSEFFNSVHSINAFHPTVDVIAGGNSSGRLSLWRRHAASDE